MDPILIYFCLSSCGAHRLAGERRSCGSGTTWWRLNLLSLTVTNYRFKNVSSNIIKSQINVIILLLLNDLNAKHVQIKVIEDEYH